MPNICCATCQLIEIGETSTLMSIVYQCTVEPFSQQMETNTVFKKFVVSLVALILTDLVPLIIGDEQVVGTVLLGTPR